MPFPPQTPDSSHKEVLRLLHLSTRHRIPPAILSLPMLLFSSTTSRPIRLRETRRAYKLKSLLVHPDRCTHPGATEAFRIVHNAYEDVVLRGWVAESSSGQETLSKEEREQEMEQWMQHTHDKYFRGRRRAASDVPFTAGYEDAVNDVMEWMDAEDEEPDVVIWLRKIHVKGERGLAKGRATKSNGIFSNVVEEKRCNKNECLKEEYEWRDLSFDTLKSQDQVEQEVADHDDDVSAEEEYAQWDHIHPSDTIASLNEPSSREDTPPSSPESSSPSDTDASTEWIRKLHAIDRRRRRVQGKPSKPRLSSSSSNLRGGLPNKSLKMCASMDQVNPASNRSAMNSLVDHSRSCSAPVTLAPTQFKPTRRRYRLVDLKGAADIEQGD
ncbi:uncharacterized protein SPPG_06133 [Spizellomyces punctatus DAOM BR117]|uniref:J domain-containing protein n=1 Tax=Spizellomyces punctatus (strain DAOM BR117) TaxID=645134 RepID=A0A0L0HC19_SPIPD|nr:uncharacterized protein SPPG_06133 [Spizellomyces punctatus DAOM BR117]KNC98429.1 hypothetical protein SPPG_06133 [Spizellomyces punctatus DAOM BR117]|eukprot:XP_016606469.1 hypothetical protein SPPG_06133 [Spizellomyces punctatus DAOM BR117]